MAQSRKITDLNRSTPRDEFAFIAATGVSNFQVLFKDIADYSSINRATGSFTDTLTVSGVPVLTGIEYIDSDISTINNEITEINNQISQITGSTTVVSGESFSSFAFFSNIINNSGPATKTYFSTPPREPGFLLEAGSVTPSTDVLLSGVTVDSAQNLKVYLRWDGPSDDYIGSGSIEGTKIPNDQIIELGLYTRRFEGYLDNLSFTGQSFISGEANGNSAIISLNELGAGPTPLSLSIDNISTATPKAGTNLGATHLKGGDQINVYAVFDNDDIETIEVYDSGISDGVSGQSYSLTNTGDGNYTATIPVTVTSGRSNTQSIAIIAKNSFGTFGDQAISSNSMDLDQVYPAINASAPTSYNGRADGLREGESTTFVNTTSNWSDLTDTIDYSVLNANISIANDATFENPKVVDYIGGVYNNQNNVEISVARNANGATDSESLTVKIANGPLISSANIITPAISAASPHVIGTTEIKNGDTVNVEVEVDTQGESANSIRLSVLNSGISNGSQTSMSSYSSVLVSGDVYKYTIPVIVTGSSSRNGAQSVTVQASNQYGTYSDTLTSSNTATVNNTAPSITITSIDYPAAQSAIKNSESATINNAISNYDTVLFETLLGQLNISNPTVWSASKVVDYNSGGYNISNNNLKIIATKTSNGMSTIERDIVKIANTPLSLSINNLASPLSSSPSGLSDNFNLVSDQQFLSAPTLSLDSSQTSPSSLTTTSSGTGTTSNSYRITASDSDTKGTFLWGVSATNLAGLSTTNISTNPNYILAGFSSRTINASPTSLGAGLANIGTTISNTSDVTFENLSEGGTAPNGGTIYTYESYPDGTQLDNSYDVDNKFTVCNSSGLTNTDGDHVFNLDKLNRAANTSTSNPAQFVIKED